MTEGTEHVIDPDGDARRALVEAVAEHGPEALSDATIMDNLCRNQLAALPGESILIVSAARAHVPALLRDKIPELGNYGAIQSVAATLAQASDLDNAASLWVVREFARALGMIAPGGTQPIPRIVPGGPPAEAGSNRQKRGGSAAADAGRGMPGAGAGDGRGGPEPLRRHGGRPGRGCSTATRSGWPPPSRWSRATRGWRRRKTCSRFLAETVAATSSQPPQYRAQHRTKYRAEHEPGPGHRMLPPDASPDASPTSDLQCSC